MLNQELLPTMLALAEIVPLPLLLRCTICANVPGFETLAGKRSTVGLTVSCGGTVFTIRVTGISTTNGPAVSFTWAV